MRIVIVTESFLPRVNGVTRTVEALTAHLRRRGHQALLFAAGPGPFEHDGYRVVRVMGFSGFLYPDLTIAPFAPGMGRLIDDFHPDLVHLASPAALGVYAARVARRRAIPVVAHYQTDLCAYARAYGGAPLARATQRLERRFHNSCTLTFAPTAATAATLRERGVEHVLVSGRGVDAERFRPDRPGAAAAAARWPDGGRPRVLCVARLAREKGLDRLVELGRRRPDLGVLVVGEGPLRRRLEAQAPANVRLAGVLVGDELADVYTAAEIFAYPSTTETFGQVVQEAMASGLPVVGVEAGGVATLVDHDRTGVLVAPPGDGFVGAVGRLAEDETTRRRMSAAARARAVKGSWSVILDKLLADYAEVVQRRLPAAAPALLPVTTRGGGGRRAAFFDVDRTILRGSSALALARPMRQAGVLTAAI